MPRDERKGPAEIAVVGDLSETESDILDKLLDVDPGDECILYFDSLGGSTYFGLAMVNLIRLRDLKATGVVIGECSSAALWPFAACHRRLVTPYSVMLFHPMKWQSEENVGLVEASEWARHFAQLEGDMDRLLAEMFGAPTELLQKWNHPGRYVLGRELVEAGMAELIDLVPLPLLRRKTRR